MNQVEEFENNRMTSKAFEINVNKKSLHYPFSYELLCFINKGMKRSCV